MDVQTTLASKKPDIVFLLETKRRFEEIGSDIDVDGYDLREVRRLRQCRGSYIGFPHFSFPLFRLFANLFLPYFGFPLYYFHLFCFPLFRLTPSLVFS